MNLTIIKESRYPEWFIDILDNIYKPITRYDQDETCEINISISTTVFIRINKHQMIFFYDMDLTHNFTDTYKNIIRGIFNKFDVKFKKSYMVTGLSDLLYGTLVHQQPIHFIENYYGFRTD